MLFEAPLDQFFCLIKTSLLIQNGYSYTDWFFRGYQSLWKLNIKMSVLIVSLVRLARSRKASHFIFSYNTSKLAACINITTASRRC